MKIYGILAVLLALALSVSAAAINPVSQGEKVVYASAAYVEPISAKDAFDKKLYAQLENSPLLIYVGGAVPGYTMSGFVPYQVIGKAKDAAYKTMTAQEYMLLRP